MAIESRRVCDHCRREIPATAKVHEFRAVLAIHNGDARQAETVKECCGQLCLHGALSDLIKAAETAPARVSATPDCHSIGRAS